MTTTSDKSPKKVILRPSKLGQIGIGINNDMSNNAVVGEEDNSNNSSPFSRSSGKRVVKPSFKLQESPLFTNISSKPNTPAKEIPATEAGAKNDFNKEKVENDVNIPEEKPIIRQSKLVLNEKLLEKLRKPSQQVNDNFFFKTYFFMK